MRYIACMNPASDTHAASDTLVAFLLTLVPPTFVRESRPKRDTLSFNASCDPEGDDLCLEFT
jgi:hypothetical protein